MAIIANLFVSAMLIMASLDFTVARVGVSYGRLGNNLPSPSKVVALYKKYNIRRMRIYDPHQSTLKALNASARNNIELAMDVPNGRLKRVASRQARADAWVQKNVLNYPNVNFRYIIVGNEVSPIKNDTSQYVPFVLPALRNIYNAISAAGLQDQIRVTTSVDAGVLTNSSPPQNAVFRPEVTPYLDPIIQFLIDTRAPLCASLYPFFAYRDDPVHVRLNFALLQPNNSENLGGVQYDNLFYAMVDAVYAALEKSVAGPSSLENSYIKVPTPKVTVSESGWSGNGKGKHPLGDTRAAAEDAVPRFASVKNERIYINNLIRVIKNGTPKRPGWPIETYIFAMFDENKKHGDETERNFGIFLPNGKPKFRITSFN